MIVEFGSISPVINKSKLEAFEINRNRFRFDTEWFINTKPSINDTDDFLPDFESKDDLYWVLMYFIRDYSHELLENNIDILCEEAIIELTDYNKCHPKEELNEEQEAIHRKKIYDKIIKLQREKR
jgi:hypothetical protein